MMADKQVASGPEAVADLYRARGLSTDTAVEAGYVVYNGLGVVKALDPTRTIRRVLIVGPGLDLAAVGGLDPHGLPAERRPVGQQRRRLARGARSRLRPALHPPPDDPERAGARQVS